MNTESRTGTATELPSATSTSTTAPIPAPATPAPASPPAHGPAAGHPSAAHPPIPGQHGAATHPGQPGPHPGHPAQTPSTGPSGGSVTALAAATGGTGGGGTGGTGTLTTPAARAPRKLAARRRPEVVAVLLFSGGPIFESSIPLSVFGIDRQDTSVPRYRLLVCAGEEGPLRTTGGLEMSAPYGLEALSRAGTIVVPAWRSISQPPPADSLDALRRAHEEGARIIGLCTGAFVLAAAGLLDGRPATTHWMYAPTLAKRYPSVHVDPRELYVDDGDVLTSAGTAAGIDLCLHVVRTDHGAEVANALARRLVVPPRRADWHSGAPRHLDRSLPEEIGADPLAEVVAWALEHLHEQFDVETLAARAYMSRRTFDRRFRTLTGSAPLQWLITQRVLQAQRLLETSDYSVDEVAGRCGFRSPVALRGHFRRQLGLSPASYRTAYRARRPQGETETAGTAGGGGAAGAAHTPGAANQHGQHGQAAPAGSAPGGNGAGHPGQHGPGGQHAPHGPGSESVPAPRRAGGVPGGPGAGSHGGHGGGHQGHAPHGGHPGHAPGRPAEGDAVARLVSGQAASGLPGGPPGARRPARGLPERAAGPGPDPRDGVRDRRDPGAYRETREVPRPREVRDVREVREVRDVLDRRDPRDPRDARELRGRGTTVPGQRDRPVG
jgi:transcriptional regulator GlxA family with amidase domain